MPVQSVRINVLNHQDISSSGQYILYWMIANRRLHHNFSLDRAIELAEDLGKPLLVLEALRCDYQWASVRFHRFIIEGMRDNSRVCADHEIQYHPFVEQTKGQGRGLVTSLAENACAVVTDDFPCFFLPRMVHAVAARISVRLESVDSNGLYPMRETDRVFTRAFSFRNHLQKTLAAHLTDFPEATPLAQPSFPVGECMPTQFSERWPAADLDRLLSPDGFTGFPIDHDIGPGIVQGGEVAARRQLSEFINNRLCRYSKERNQPDDDPSSGLSPFLHFGHISSHEVFQAVTTSEEWSTSDLGDVRKIKGSREGWWGMSPDAESFLDELITWREIGYNAACHDPDFARYQSLPDFARTTLELHASDEREYIYSYEQFRDFRTHDDIWNAAQNQLVTEGRMHNYLRMLWGKKILEWSPTPQHALETMIDLNNRYALDGRNPNSYSGIFWVLGRYDRAWGPERPVFGKIRFMSSENTRRKIRLKGYLEKYGVANPDRLF